LKIEEMRSLKDDALDKQLKMSQQELFDLRLKLTTKQLANHREVRRVKKDIARLETLKKERELNIR
jgi:large subunit ribosomal protein L29